MPVDDRRATPRGLWSYPMTPSRPSVALGPAALPTLLAWLRQSDSSLSRSAKIVLEGRLGLPVRVPTHQKRGCGPCPGGPGAGPAASSAFREIAAIALNSPDEWQRGDAIDALTNSDADTIRRFAEGLKSPEPEVRLRAVDDLQVRIAPDEVYLPGIEGATNDLDTRVRADAAKGVAFINQQLAGYRGLSHPS